PHPPPFPTRRSSDLAPARHHRLESAEDAGWLDALSARGEVPRAGDPGRAGGGRRRSAADDARRRGWIDARRGNGIEPGREPPRKDRKSTRLNSSHVK